uniref:Uncharacterized protein n=1 Tax=Anas platyrhynchos platyrhynchos TaxID=8840 RepID=A0A493TK32_ANAPP
MIPEELEKEIERAKSEVRPGGAGWGEPSANPPTPLCCPPPQCTVPCPPLHRPPPPPLPPAPPAPPITPRPPQGAVPFFVSATCGTTVLGAFDPLQSVADVCQRHGLWLHVDVSQRERRGGLGGSPLRPPHPLGCPRAARCCHPLCPTGCLGRERADLQDAPAPPGRHREVPALPDGPGARCLRAGGVEGGIGIVPLPPLPPPHPPGGAPPPPSASPRGCCSGATGRAPRTCSSATSSTTWPTTPATRRCSAAAASTASSSGCSGRPWAPRGWSAASTGPSPAPGEHHGPLPEPGGGRETPPSPASGG